MGRSPQSLAVASEFGARVRNLRQHEGWSIERLAQESGLHWTYVGSVERGERNLSLQNICRLAVALSTPVSVLTHGLEDHL